MTSLSDHTVLSAELIKGRKHIIRLLVMTRPASPTDYASYYTAIADDFAYRHGAKIVGRIELLPLPFRESAELTFIVRAYKHPERHTRTSLLRTPLSGQNAQEKEPAARIAPRIAI
jgi:hypothetical protein